MEDLALNLFRNGSGKNSGLNTVRGSALNSRKNSLTNKKTSALNSRKGSIHNDTSIKGEIPNRTAILQAVGQDTIPEENEGEEEGKKKESKNISQRKSLKSSKYK